MGQPELDMGLSEEEGGALGVDMGLSEGDGGLWGEREGSVRTQVKIMLFSPLLKHLH